VASRKSRWRIFLGLAVGTFVLACALAYLLATERVWFLWLQLNRRNPATAQKYAALLSQRRAGVDLALADFGLLGGSTRGWSNWILENSPYEDYVGAKLKGIVANDRTSLSRRLAALLMLWDKTRDAEYLEKCFVAVRDPGPPIVSFGRDAIASAIGYKELSVQLTVPRNSQVPLDVAQFRKLLADSGVLTQEKPPGNSSQ